MGSITYPRQDKNADPQDSPWDRTQRSVLQHLSTVREGSNQEPTALPELNRFGVLFGLDRDEHMLTSLELAEHETI